MFKTLFALARTEDEISALKAALREQWEWNHYEHCGNGWPHPEGAFCGWPLPVALGGDPVVYRTYTDFPRRSSSST